MDVKGDNEGHKRADLSAMSPSEHCCLGALTARDVMAEVLRRLDGPSAGALRGACGAARAAVDATLPRAAPPRAAPLPELCALLEQLPSLRELSLAACAEGALSGLSSLACADAALRPLRDLLTGRLTGLATLELPLPPLLHLGTLEWARVWAAGAVEEGKAAGQSALRAALEGRYDGAYRGLQWREHAVLLLPGSLLGPAVRKLVVTRASGGSPIWPDDQATCVWLEPQELTQLQALHLEHACLTHVPPPVLCLAAAPAARLRELRLHCCQIRQLPDDAVSDLTALTSLGLSGNFLKALPDGLSRLAALRALDVSKNCLPTLCNGLGALSRLERLDASSNQLLALPRCLRGLAGLRALALSHNWLSGAAGLGEAAAAWPALTELRLANVSDKRGALVVPAAALAERCPRLAVLDLTAQFDLDEPSLAGLSACRRLRALEVGWPARGGAAAARLAAALPGLAVL
ncbi:MAG: hypothetical protein J3K34DRAFT_522181 [Monoraphidium minutum]|nr:MAG: hypothetical protein J3K34DRAFT_522181 [Monoraphidium minutum]